MCGRLPVGKGYFEVYASWSGGRLHDQTLDTPLMDKPRQSEAVIVRFVAQRHLQRLTRKFGHAVPRCVQLRHQHFGIAAFDWMQARIIPSRNLDRQEPVVLAQLQSCMNRLFFGRRQ